MTYKKSSSSDIFFISNVYYRLLFFFSLKSVVYTCNYVFNNQKIYNWIVNVNASSFGERGNDDTKVLYYRINTLYYIELILSRNKLNF